MVDQLAGRELLQFLKFITHLLYCQADEEVIKTKLFSLCCLFENRHYTVITRHSATFPSRILSFNMPRSSWSRGKKSGLICCRAARWDIGSFVRKTFMSYKLVLPFSPIVSIQFVPSASFVNGLSYHANREFGVPTSAM